VSQVLFSSEYQSLSINRDSIKGALQKRLSTNQSISFSDFYDELRAISLMILKNPDDPNDLNLAKKQQQDIDSSILLNESIMDEEKQLVEVGLITSVDQAKELASAWLAKNPGYEWRGQYRTTIPGKMSVIEVQKIPIVDMENLS